MVDVHPAVAHLTAALDRAETLARDADSGDPWRLVDGPNGPAVRVNETLDGEWTRDGIGVSSAYTCDDPHDDCHEARARYRAEARLIVEFAAPEAVLRRVQFDRITLAEHQPRHTAAGEAECGTCVGVPAFSQPWPADWPCDTVLAVARAWGWNG